MTLKQYKAFVYSVDYGSISKAAEILNSTQSALTHLISDFEDEIGFSLMIRNKSGIKLTENGRKIYYYAKEVLVKDDELINSIKKIQGQSTCRITIATFTSVAVNWLPQIMNGYKSEHPEVTFNILDGGYGDIIKAIESGRADVGFISLPLGGNFISFPLLKEKMFAILPINHSLANESSFPVRLFETEPVISLGETTDFDSRNIFEYNGIRPNITYRTTDDYAMISMVENNLGICIEPELLLKGRKDNVKILELDPPAFRTIGLAISKDNINNNTINSFKDYIINWVNNNH